jgi:hypothetical protein
VVVPLGKFPMVILGRTPISSSLKSLTRIESSAIEAL